MNTSTKMAYHNGGWTCPTPFYTEDWTHRDMCMSFIFLVIVFGVIIFAILDYTYIKILREKFWLALHLVEVDVEKDTDPDLTRSGSGFDSS